MQHIFIINKGTVSKKIDDIKDICNYLKIDYQIYVTNTREETINVASYFKDESCVIYAVGGDGTVNAVLNGIMDSHAYLGILPLGSGNDFYRSLQERNQTVTDCNVMKINDMYALNIFSIGIDAEICAAADKMKNLHVPKSQIYNLGMVYAYLKHKNIPMLIKIDGKSYYSPLMTMVTVCNGKYYGGGFKIAPNANIESNYADLYMINDLGKLTLLKFLSSVLKGTHEQDFNVNKKQVQQLEIITDESVVANADGELMYSDNYNITTNAGQIKVVNNNEILSLIRKK